MSPPVTADRARRPKTAGYRLDAQVGFRLRQAHQRHTTLFAARMVDGVTPMQWAALVRLSEEGPMSPADLGRSTAMDAATLKGVADRLALRGLVEAAADPDDGRRLVLSLTGEGRALVARALPLARAITEETLAPLSPAERALLLDLLDRLR